MGEGGSVHDRPGLSRSSAGWGGLGGAVNHMPPRQHEVPDPIGGRTCQRKHPATILPPWRTTDPVGQDISSSSSSERAARPPRLRKSRISGE